ncbi:MAG: diphosphomevalonate decarboxylase, partial [Gammaproteobacteria bacterium]|nr:diphosphomevalonate decarboxylase [Gammaproteobacteria bacterium]
MTQATARAHPNIALVKYWGKRDTRLNLPAVGSISITLDTLHTITEVKFDAELAGDSVLLNGKANEEEAARVTACVDLLREIAGVQTRVEVRSSNNFPTGAGLAS